MFLITDKNTYMVQEIDDLRDIVGDEIFTFLKEYIEEYGKTKYEEGQNDFNYEDCCGCPELEDMEESRDEVQRSLSDLIGLCNELCEDLPEEFEWFKNEFIEFKNNRY